MSNANVLFHHSGVKMSCILRTKIKDFILQDDLGPSFLSCGSQPHKADLNVGVVKKLARCRITEHTMTQRNLKFLRAGLVGCLHSMYEANTE